MRPETLLAHTSFLRGLAARLVRDVAEADDVVADAWLAAVERPPRESGARAWLAQVVRNQAGRRHRGVERRRRREAAADRPAEALSPATIVAHRETIQSVVDEVFKLREPYRSVILLRFYEDLPAGEVATRLGVPVDTVRTRQKRALAELRERLDARAGGDRRSWCLGLVAALKPPRPATAVAAPLTVGLLTMSTLLKLTAGTALIAALSAPFLLSPTDAPTRPAATGPSVATAAGPRETPDSPTEESLVRAEIEPTTDATPVTTSIAAPSPWHVRGTTTDGDGEPLPASVAIYLDGVSPPRTLATAVADRDGAFEIDIGPQVEVLPWYLRRVRVMARAELSGHRLSTEEVAADLMTPDALRPADLVLRRGPPMLRLRVLDASGAPVEYAEIGLQPVGEDGYIDYDWARPESSGHLAVSLPRDAGAYTIHVLVRDRGAGRVGPIDLAPDRDQMAPDVQVRGPGLIDGVVRTPDGAPVADVWVTAHRSSRRPSIWPLVTAHDDGGIADGTTRTDEHGRFRIEGLALGHVFVSVYEAELVPTATPSFEVGSRGINLVVERYQTTIRLVDEQGAPIRNATLNYKAREYSMSGVHNMRGDDVVLHTERFTTFDVVASAPGRTPAGATIAPAEGRYQATATLVLAAPTAVPGRLRVAVNDRGGEPVPAARVSLYHDSEVESITGALLSVIVPHGEVIDLVPTGTFRVDVHPLETTDVAGVDAYFEPLQTTASVSSDAETSLTLTARREARIRVTIRSLVLDDGENLSGLAISWTPSQGVLEWIPSWTVTTDDGRRRTSRLVQAGVPAVGEERLAPGAGTLSIRANDHRPIEKSLVLPPGETTDVAIILDPAE